MSERDVGKALLGLDAADLAGVPDARRLTWQVLERDRRRLRRLAGLATLFWVLTAAGVIWLVFFYFLQVAPRLRAYGAGRAQLQNDWNDWALVGDWAAQSILAGMIALLAAAVCTILLVVLSRRATLRQINASLIEISEQLRQLRPAATA